MVPMFVDRQSGPQRQQQQQQQQQQTNKQQQLCRTNQIPARANALRQAARQGVSKQGVRKRRRLHCWLLATEKGLASLLVFMREETGFIACLFERRDWIHCWFFLCLPRASRSEREYRDQIERSRRRISGG